MKNTIFNYSIVQLIVIVLLSFAYFSCKKNCNIDRPKNLKPIDWENYNDAYTVYWNYTGDCADFPLGKTGKTIKMYGWIFQPTNVYPHSFNLLSDSLLVEDGNPKCAMIRVQCFNAEELEKIKAKFDSSDLKKKCYIIGEIVVFDEPDNHCCLTSPDVLIEGTNSIFFDLVNKK